MCHQNVVVEMPFVIDFIKTLLFTIFNKKIKSNFIS